MSLILRNFPFNLTAQSHFSFHQSVEMCVLNIWTIFLFSLRKVLYYIFFHSKKCFRHLLDTTHMQTHMQERRLIASIIFRC